MKILVIYFSKTGFTKQYVDWLAEEVPCETVAFQEADHMDLLKYDTVIFASSMYAGSIINLGWFQKKSEKVKNKILLVTGAAPVDSQTFPKEAGQYQMFYLQSGLKYDKMGLKDKLMMKGFNLFLKAKKDKSEFDKMMAEKVSHSHDDSKREYIKPLIEYINKM